MAIDVSKHHLFFKLFYRNGEIQKVYGQLVGNHYVLEVSDGEKHWGKPFGIQIFAPGFSPKPNHQDSTDATGLEAKGRLFEFYSSQIALKYSLQGHVTEITDASVIRDLSGLQSLTQHLRLRVLAPCPIYREKDLVYELFFNFERKNGDKQCVLSAVVDWADDTTGAIGVSSILPPISHGPGSTLGKHEYQLSELGYNKLITNLNKAEAKKHELLDPSKSAKSESWLGENLNIHVKRDVYMRPTIEGGRKKVTGLRGRWKRDSPKDFWRLYVFRKFKGDQFSSGPIFNGGEEIILVWKHHALRHYEKKMGVTTGGITPPPSWILEIVKDDTVFWADVNGNPVSKEDVNAKYLTSITSLTSVWGTVYSRWWRGLTETYFADVRRARTLLFEITGEEFEPLRYLVGWDKDSRYHFRQHPPRVISKASGFDLEFLSLRGLVPYDTHLRIGAVRTGNGEDAAAVFGELDYHLSLPMKLKKTTVSYKDKEAKPGMPFFRLGALDCQPGRYKVAGKATYCSFDFKYAEGVGENHKFYDLELVGYELGQNEEGQSIPIKIPIADVRPGGTGRRDDLTYLDSSGKSPFILPIRSEEKISNQKASFILEISEKNSITTGQNLRLSLKKEEGVLASSQDEKLFYMDKNPFLVGLIALKQIKDFEPGSGSEIAYWSSEGAFRGWQLKATVDGFDLILPPQVLGEEMEKRTGNSDIGEGELVDFRFTTPAKLSLKSSELIRNYGLVPWDLEFYLNSLRDSRLVGLPLEKAEFEFLYGLRTTLESNSRLRIAEIFSRFGSPASRLPMNVRSKEYASDDFDVDYARYRTVWDGYLKALENRLAVYELFEEDQQEFSESGELMGLQLHGEMGRGGPQAYLVANGDKEKDDVVGHEPAFKPSWNSDLTNKFNHRIPVYEDGLAGSFAWAFESRFLFEALYNDPVPSTAKKIEAVEVNLARIFFSALGGWGTQEAVFDNGKAKIQVTVDMGRVTELRVERVGRVAVLWNKAKMVTVFRRTVVPTEQFAVEQDTHLGRPMLRKVEEYIEFIEKHRTHPDLQTVADDPRHPGCLIGSSCDEKILVNSRWGIVGPMENGRPLGWKVPFRIPSARSKVYGPANVLLHFHSHPGSEDPVTTACIENLDDLYFYTDLNPQTTANTDKWLPQPRVDYGDFAMPTSEQRPLDGGQARYGTPPITQAAGPFTFRLGCLGDNVNLCAHLQSGKPAEQQSEVSASLRYYTMTRGVMQAEPDNSEKDRPLGKLREEVEAVCSLLDQLPVKRPKGVGDPERSVVKTAITKSLKTALNKQGKLPGNPFGRAEAALVNLKKNFQDPQNIYDQIKGKVTVDLKGTLLWNLEQGARQLKVLPLAFQQYADDLQGEIKKLEKNLQIKPAVKVEKARALVKRYLKDFMQRVDNDRAASTLYGKFDDIIKQLDDLLKELKIQRKNVVALKGRVTGVSTQTKAKTSLKEIRKLAEEVDTKLIDVVKEKLPVFRKIPLKFELAPVSSLLHLAESKMEPAARKGGAAIKQARDKVLALLGDRNKGLILEIIEVEEALNAAKTKVVQIQKNLGNPDESLSTKLNTLSAKLEKRAEAIKAESIKELDILLMDAKADASKLEKDLNKSLDEEIAKATKQADTVCTDLLEGIYDKTFDRITGSADQLIKSLKDDLDLLGDYYDDAKEINEWVNSRRRILNSALHEIPMGVENVIDKAGKLLLQKPGNSLKAIRAVGSNPEAALLAFKGMSDFSGLDKELAALDRQVKSTGYVFRELGAPLEMTPLIAMVDNTEDYLGDRLDEVKMKASELALPVTEVGKQVKADLESLKKQSKDALFKGIAGLKKFVRGAIGEDLADRIEKATTIETKTDPKTLTGFVDARINNLRLGEDSTIFSFGPISLRLRDPYLDAHTRMERTRDGRIRKTSVGKITADWEMTLQGNNLLTFKETSVICKDGKVKVDLDPSKLELSGVLQALADLSATYEGGDDAFRFGLIQDLPKKLEAFCELSVIIPPVEAGTFAVTNLSFGAHLRIILGAPVDGNNMPNLKGTELTISAGLNLSSEKAPFAIIVFILGGCGWLNVTARYSLPLSGGSPRLAVDVSIAIGAAAFLGINLGFLNGSLYVSLSIEIKAVIVRAETNKKYTEWSILLTFIGRASIFGIVSVSLTIVLAIRYSSGGGMVGSGYVSLRIKICWCYKLKVEKAFTYQFKSAKGGQGAIRNGQPHRLSDPRQKVMSAHERMMANLNDKENRRDGEPVPLRRRARRNRFEGLA